MPHPFSSTIVIREAGHTPEVITIDDFPDDNPPMDLETMQEAATPPPPCCPPAGSREVLSRPPPSPYRSPPHVPRVPVPSSIPPWPGVVEILETGSATRLPDITELTPEFLRMFDDLYQGGYDLTYVLDHSEFLETLDYSYPPY